MPPARPLGSVARRTLRDLLDVHDTHADDLADAMEDLLDGDNDTTRAQAILIRLARDNGKEAAVLGHLERGDMTRAEDAAAALARSTNRRP